MHELRHNPVACWIRDDSHLLVNTQSTLNQAGANLHDTDLEPFALLLLPEMSLQKGLKNSQEGGRAWHANGKHQEVSLQARVDLEA